MWCGGGGVGVSGGRVWGLVVGGSGACGVVGVEWGLVVGGCGVSGGREWG